MKLGSKHTAEAKRKIGNASRGRKHTLESRRKMSEAKRGQKRPPFSLEHRRKIGEAQRGRKPSLETRRRISEAQKGRKFSSEHCRRISEALTGKKPKLSLDEQRKRIERMTGENNPNWKGGHRKSRKYLIVWNPDHPSANVSGYVFEHRLIMEKILGRPLRSGEVVHHINKNHTDNRGENLMLFPSQTEHMAYHRKSREI